MSPSSPQKTTNSCAFRSAHPPSQPLSLFPFFPTLALNQVPGRRKPGTDPRAPLLHRTAAAERLKLPFVPPGSLSSPADPPGRSPSVTFCAGAGGWLGWSAGAGGGGGGERSSGGKGSRRLSEPAWRGVRDYLFIFSLFIDRTSRAARGARGDAGPPTGGEAACRPPDPSRSRAPPASALRRLPASAPAPAPRRRRRPPSRPAAPQPRRPAPRRPDLGGSGGAVSWQERVPSAVAASAPFELVAAARLACAWRLEGEKEERSKGGWEKGESSLELHLYSGRLGFGC